MADTTSLHLRLPKSLYKRLQRQAKRNHVSLNTEIINQLSNPKDLGIAPILRKEIEKEIVSIPFIVQQETGDLGAPILRKEIETLVRDAFEKEIVRIPFIVQQETGDLGAPILRKEIETLVRDVRVAQAEIETFVRDVRVAQAESERRSQDTRAVLEREKGEEQK
jgi:hypothetical protein